MNRFLLIFVFSFSAIYCNSQVVVLDPPSPSSEDSVRVIFDASEGDRGLMGFTGDIWAHTGVHTNLGTWRYVVAEWGQNIEKAKLAPLGDNKWELKLSPSIREFYEVDDEELITHLAFVFRNNGGSRTGRDNDGADIIVPLSLIDINLTQPESRWFLAEEGERILR